MRYVAPALIGLLSLGCSKGEMSAEAPTTTGAGAPAAATTPAAPGAPAAATEVMGTATLGRPAPDFTLPTLDGETIELGAHRGAIVVLEWFNPDCPFVNQAHLNGSLKGMAKRYAGDVVWLAINSNAEGEQGHHPERNREGRERFGIAYPIAFDRDGRVGRAYGAERTPHMYVVAPDGTLVYRGAIDNSSGGDLEDVADVKNYVDMAIEDLRAEREVRVPETKAWGCSVKYGS